MCDLIRFLGLLDFRRSDSQQWCAWYKKEWGSGNCKGHRSEAQQYLSTSKTWFWVHGVRTMGNIATCIQPWGQEEAPDSNKIGPLVSIDYPVDWLTYDKVIINILCPLLTVLWLEITIVSFSRGLTSLELCLLSASLTGMFLAVPRLVYHQLNFAATFLSGRGDLSLSSFIGVLFWEHLHIWVKYWFLVPSWVWEYLQGGFEILLMNSMNFTRRCIMDLKENQAFWERKWH